MAGSREVKRKPGAVRLRSSEKRALCVSSRMNEAELEWLDGARGHMPRGEYLRSAAMGVLPPTIPAINREAWLSLARLLSNINQYQAQVNQGFATAYPDGVISELLFEIKELRKSLINTEDLLETGLIEEISPKKNNKGAI